MDAYIMNMIFGYKVLNGDVCGFPDTTLNKVLNTLNDSKISYQIIDVDKDPVIKDFGKINSYSKYLQKALESIDKKSNNAKEFLILTKYKEFINILDDVIENIPKKDIYYKNKLKEISINLLYYINKANNEEDYNKINNYKVEIKSLIELIDYILERLYIKKYISKNSINKLGYKLIEINKMSSKWMENKISYASGNK